MNVSNRSTLHHEDLDPRLEPGKIPLTYANATEEYWTIKKAVGLADMSHLGRLRITGKDRVSFLNGLLTNDISQLKENKGQRSALLNSKARVLADLHLYAQPDSLLIDTGESPASHVKEILDRFIITEDVQIQDSSQDLVQLTVQGPRSSQAIKEVLGAETKDLKQLDHFVRVTELGSFTKAAALLSVAQSALSHQVRALEVELKQSLLYRTGRGVTPTDAGKRLLGHARGILMQVDRARDELAETRGAPVGNVILGLPASIARVLTLPLLRSFRQSFPSASLGIVEGLSAYVIVR